MGNIIIIIILGLIAFALALIARLFRETRDGITIGLDQALLKSREAVSKFPSQPTQADCDNLKKALRDLDQAIGNVPPGLDKYDTLKRAAEAVRDSIQKLLEKNCG